MIVAQHPVGQESSFYNRLVLNKVLKPEWIEEMFRREQHVEVCGFMYQCVARCRVSSFFFSLSFIPRSSVVASHTLSIVG